MYFFTSDEHYGHSNIIKYCNRPFSNVYEMNKTLVENHNKKVKDKDTTVHAGDFSLSSYEKVKEHILNLKGKHIFLKGSHDQWIKKYEKETGERVHEILELNVTNTLHVVVCHYSMRVWPRSHFGSIQLFGHSHGKLNPLINQYDIGVDSNNFEPLSISEILRRINYEIVT